MLQPMKIIRFYTSMKGLGSSRILDRYLVVTMSAQLYDAEKKTTTLSYGK